MMECEAEGGLKLLVANAGDEYFAVSGDVPAPGGAAVRGPVSTARCSPVTSTCGNGTSAPARRWGSPKRRSRASASRSRAIRSYVVAQSALNAARAFAGIAEATLAAITALAKREEYRSRQLCCTTSAIPADDFFVLESGRVEFLIGRDERVSPAGFMLRKGEVFGWAALLENQPQAHRRARPARTRRSSCASTASRRCKCWNAIRRRVMWSCAGYRR